VESTIKRFRKTLVVFQIGPLLSAELKRPLMAPVYRSWNGWLSVFLDWCLCWESPLPLKVIH